MIRTLRAFFLSRLLREKLLLLAFLAFAVAWWASVFSARAARFWREQKATTATLADQRSWINRSGQVEAAAKQAAARFRPEKTLDLPRLNATVLQAASDAGLRNNTRTNANPNQTSPQGTIHSVTVSVNGATYAAAKKFYENLQQHVPYIGIDSFVMAQAARTNPVPDSLNLNVKVSSFENLH